MIRDRFRAARLLALLIPLALLGGALAFQYIGKLYPCEMCWWQRYPHIVALVLAALAFVVPGRVAQTALVGLAALAILVSGLIGVYHAGVEYHWWAGVTACTSTVSGPITLDSIMNAPIIRCDVAQWTLFHVSLAGYNALFSSVGALTIFALMRRKAA
ncbi:disulfide bond formation protein B [Sphingomonas echinoides]|uniref:Disulfide bond formation protein B n=1 Tax=Sphingomonas echinoides TaxID=59803 RepID=A0ABU4PR21_9SPHN|nr:disulfide bond formation protein B [Sphingomonas echinoides]MDX5986252.1 disulfide bond formation protein B [Sphingomonas echinoides]